MGKIIPFHRNIRVKKTTIEQHNRSEDGSILLFLEITFTNEQIHILKKIFDSQIKYHGKRDDYMFILEIGLKGLNDSIGKPMGTMFFHVYEIYYYRRIVEFEMDMFQDSYDAQELSIVNEILEIISYYEEAYEKTLEEFAGKTADDKLIAIVGVWDNVSRIN